MTTKEFNKLTKAQKRVEVAKDVLKNIRSNRIIAQQGDYLNLDYMHNQLSGDDDVQSNLDKLKYCECCALGACLLSITKYKNKLTFNNIEEVSGKSYSLAGNMLRQTFSPNQITLIECCFEGGTGGRRIGFEMGQSLSAYQMDLCRTYSYKFYDDTLRLRKIMNNIIRNQGKFIPEQDLNKKELKELKELQNF